MAGHSSASVSLHTAAPTDLEAPRHPEHLARLKEGVGGWNQWRREHREADPDFSEANLSEANLSEANFHEADRLAG